MEDKKKPDLPRLSLGAGRKLNLTKVEEGIKQVQTKGFGEVTAKIKNGRIYRILVLEDTIIEED